ncbi:hypothetical protein K503DRAFT_366255 [Rhizopogon vinicolor AM-OR11-026]|uniref:Uncharacterized protein n=1 Tax=Rhizopogon vinicolor AM-OR11-026 TaxID=1314800 RepID=A0A1B7MSB1_9AGAM|nr:hypothetical protein K503DRAFT_366255 [Rhizopogon vinicolor AM-OR11-026]
MKTLSISVGIHITPGFAEKLPNSQCVTSSPLELFARVLLVSFFVWDCLAQSGRYQTTSDNLRTGGFHWELDPCHLPRMV